MFFSRPAGHKYVHRTTPAKEDFDETDLTVEITWTDIILPDIVPVGTIAVLLGVYLKTTEANRTIQFRKNGDDNFVEGNGLTTQVAGQGIRNHFWVACDADRKIEYYKGAATWTNINVTVLAWII